MLPDHLLRELPHDFALAIRTTTSNYHKAYQIMDIFHHTGVCLSLQRTAHNLRRYLHNMGVDTSKLHMVDPLARVIGSLIDSENTSHIPYNLNHMIDGVEKALQQLPLKERFVIVDSLHALPLIYPDEKTVSFLREFNNRIKMHHAKAVYIYDKEKMHEPLQKKLHRYVDKVIEMQ